MKSNIIAIQGLKAAGKSTCAKMFRYLLNWPSIFHYYWLYKILGNVTFGKYKIVQYADKLKEMLSVLLNVKRKMFEDRTFKEQYYVDFNTLNITVNPSLPVLDDQTLNKHIKTNLKRTIQTYSLAIRQLLQIFGTQVMREYFGDKLWILTTLKSKYKTKIISDQRFIIENEEAKKHNAFIVHIIRPECNLGYHESELEVKTLLENKAYDVLLNNNGTLKDLFNNIKNIIYGRM